MLYLTLVPFTVDKSGSCYNVIMPKIHYTFAVLLFVILPVLILFAYGWLRFSGVEIGLFLPYFSLYAVLTCAMLAEFFISGLHTIEELKLEHRVFMERQIKIQIALKKAEEGSDKTKV